jgi:hypothetical protein
MHKPSIREIKSRLEPLYKTLMEDLAGEWRRLTSQQSRMSKLDAAKPVAATALRTSPCTQQLVYE